jgi:hypothetical protein
MAWLNTEAENADIGQCESITLAKTFPGKSWNFQLENKGRGGIVS